MAQKIDSTTIPTLEISRSFAAPRDLVFSAWSSTEHVKNWFSPSIFTVPEAEIDCQTGGVFNLCMRGPDGQDHWMRGHFTEVAAPEYLAFLTSVSYASEAKFTVNTRVTFSVEGAGTCITVQQSYEIHDPNFAAAVAGAEQGWRSTLDKLALEVARMQTALCVTHGSFTISRDYGATPERVFAALADQTEKAKWFEVGGGYEVIERVMDVQPGGREICRARWPNGMITCFDAIYHDVVPNQRLIYSYVMHIDARKISASLATITLQRIGALTRLTVTEQGAFFNGYEDGGARESGTGGLLDRLGRSLGD